MGLVSLEDDGLDSLYLVCDVVEASLYDVEDCRVRRSLFTSSRELCPRMKSGDMYLAIATLGMFAVIYGNMQFYVK